MWRLKKSSSALNFLWKRSENAVSGDENNIHHMVILDAAPLYEISSVGSPEKLRKCLFSSQKILVVQRWVHFWKTTPNGCNKGSGKRSEGVQRVVKILHFWGHIFFRLNWTFTGSTGNSSPRPPTFVKNAAEDSLLEIERSTDVPMAWHHLSET
jgi:hypothetical protein